MAIRDRAACLTIGAVGAAFLAFGSAPAEGVVKSKLSGQKLRVIGSARDDVVTLSLNSNNTRILEVNVDRGRDRRFKTKAFKRVIVLGRARDDVIGIDESNGAIPARERILISAGRGEDTLGFNGSDDGENAVLSANGQRLGLARDGTANVDGVGVEGVLIRPLGGDDSVTLGDLSSTDVTQADLEFAGNPSTGEGDGQADSLIVDAPDGADSLSAGGDSSEIVVGGLAYAVTGADPEAGADRLTVNGNGGDDTISAAALAAGVVTYTATGGPGADGLTGSGGADQLSGGDEGDAFQWDPSGGSDVVEGGGGTDAFLANGSDEAEQFELSANGARLGLLRDLGGIAIDAGGLESFKVNPLGGADAVTIGDLGGTGLTEATVDLEGTPGGNAPDGASDAIVVNGTAGDDNVTIGGAGIVGLPAAIPVQAGEGADRVTVNGNDGADRLDASTLGAGLPSLTLDGGAGGDQLLGSASGDVADGGEGDDAASLGDGADTFVWNAGDGADAVEGEGGTDTALVNGSGGADTFDLAPNAGRLGIALGGVSAINGNDLETVDLNPLGGTDTVLVTDLAGSDVTNASLDLEASSGGGVADGQVDTVTVAGTVGADVFGVNDTATGLNVFGLAVPVDVARQEVSDRLILSGLADDDVIDASGLPAGLVSLTEEGGLGEEIFLGSAGDDFFDGGDGDDTALMGAGNDTFSWEPGDDNDILEGQAGTADRLLFNGANIAENIDISPNGGRITFFRNVANVMMDLNDTEVIEFNALGGADVVNVNSLVGTDATQINTDLASTMGGSAGDGAADNVFVDGTTSVDIVTVAGDGAGTSVTGLSAVVAIEHGEAGSDRVTVNGDAGNDSVNGAGMGAGAVAMTQNGDANNDFLIGGDNDDILNGGAGDDTLVGGPGADTLDGGTGTNTLIP